MAAISLTARPFNWINDKEGPNAIHGFVRSLLWNIAEVTPSSVLLTVTIYRDTYATRGYPFSLELQLSYSLDQLGLSCQFNIRNAGTAHAPVGMGFHPYFTVGTVTIDEAEGADSGHALSGFGETLIPTGRLLPVQDSPWDCREFRRIGQTRFNHCYMRLQPDQDGSCRASLRNPKTGRTIAIGMDRAFTALVVNTGDDCEFAKAGIGHRTHDLFDGCLQPSCLGDCECCHPARRTPAVIRSSPAVRRSTPPILVLLCQEKTRRAQ